MEQINNSIRPLPCKIIDIYQETKLEYTFRLETDMNPSPGQFVELSIPKVGECPISVSAAGEGWLEFTIRSVGVVTEEMFRMKLGEILFIRGPYGNGWPIKEIQDKHIVVISGGTGLAPVRMLLNDFYNGVIPTKSVSLISGFKNFDGVMFSKELEEWKSKFSTWYCLDNQEVSGWHKGFVTEYIGDIKFDTFDDNFVVLVVGPPQMMKFVGQKLKGYGISDEKIWMSFERKMSCGLGKCGHCRIDEVYVCLDGPVFNYTKAKYLVD